MAGAAIAEGTRPSAVAQTNSVDFTRDIQPIFAERCYSCHGAEKQKSGFRLDVKERAMAGGDTGNDIVPRKSSESLLYRYVAGLHPEIRMPPKGGPLSSRQIELLARWIDSGAIWPEKNNERRTAPSPLALFPKGRRENRKAVHWAFTRPERPELPMVKKSRWVRNPIDTFVLSKLESHNISPSAEADKATLI